MKQKDIAVIIAVAGVSTVIAFVLAGFAFGTPKHRQAEVQVLDSISADFPTPDKKYFNPNSVDPTQTVQIGDTNNAQPFNK